MKEVLDYTDRTACLITGEKDLEHLHTLKNFPVYIGCTEEPESKDIFANMEWYISKTSGIIQLKKLLPLEIIYPGYHSEAVGKVWENHHKEFADFLGRNLNIGNVVEMGGSNGKLAELVCSMKGGIDWEIIEPNPDPNYIPTQANILVKQSFIEDLIDDTGTIENFVHSHVLEHLYDPMDILEKISLKQTIGQKMIFSVPNLHEYLKNKYANAINFEHTYFLTDDITTYCLSSLGYEIQEKYQYSDHSIFYAARKIDGQLSNDYPEDLYEKYKSLYLDMIKFFDLEVRRIDKIARGFKGKSYLFGAHIFSQFLLHNGLEDNLFQGILDNSLVKQNKRLYGTSLKVLSPEEVKNQDNILVVVKAGQYQEEVENQLRYLNPSIKLVR